MEFLVPESNWAAPTAPPDLLAWGVKRVSIDLENRDDGLAVGRGPGWAHRAGYVCGVGVAWEGGSMYLPMRHPETENLEAGAVGSWLKGLVDGGVRIVCQNSSYDWGWIGAEWGIRPPTEIDDTIAAAVMLDENRLSYDLDSLCAWQGVAGKDETALIEAGRAFGLGQTTREVKANLWRLPGRFVGPYGAQDPASTLALWNQMIPQIEAQDLVAAYRLECDIIPLVVEMRRRGIRIDIDRAERMQREFIGVRNSALGELSDHIAQGRAVTIHDVLSPAWLERTFSAEKVPFTRTAKTERGSFSTDWMDDHPHWLPQLVSRARRYNDAAEKFLANFILGYTHRGRVHPEIHSRRTDEGGTRSFRFSYSDPPLQQMPSPKRGDKAIGKAVRSCFLPEHGEQWAKLDWSQQEYRLIVHFAAVMGLEKAGEVAQIYASDPKTDFHQVVADMTGLARPEAKDANFARAYGAGASKFATMIGKSQEEAKRTLDQLNREAPFIKGLADACSSAASRRGYIRLIDGARSRFEQWEPGWGYKGRYEPPCSHSEALRRVSDKEHPWHGAQLRRAFTHKAMNRLIQGSSARQCKLAMREMWREGTVPLLQLHDEVDLSFSDPRTHQRAKEIMETVVDLRVPMMAEADVGPSWGEVD